MQLQKAQRHQVKLRIGLSSPISQNHWELRFSGF